MAGPWLVHWHPEPAAAPLLLCVPPAGASCGQFRDWQDRLGTGVSVVGVQLPGRESRWRDPAPGSVDEVVHAVAAELTALVPAGHPVTVFGHSFGGLLGHEIALLLEEQRVLPPRALVVSACRPPEHWVSAGRGLVDDDEELERLLDARGLEPDDLDEDSRELMLEVLRADARLSLSYRLRGDARLVCRLEAWGGSDDKTVSPEQVAGWRAYAAGEFGERILPGGHYFCLQDPQPALELLRPMIRPPAGQPEGSAR